LGACEAPTEDERGCTGDQHDTDAGLVDAQPQDIAGTPDREILFAQERQLHHVRNQEEKHQTADGKHLAPMAGKLLLARQLCHKTYHWDHI